MGCCEEKRFSEDVLELQSSMVRIYGLMDAVSVLLGGDEEITTDPCESDYKTAEQLLDIVTTKIRSLKNECTAARLRSKAAVITEEEVEEEIESEYKQKKLELKRVYTAINDDLSKPCTSNAYFGAGYKEKIEKLRNQLEVVDKENKIRDEMITEIFEKPYTEVSPPEYDIGIINAYLSKEIDKLPNSTSRLVVDSSFDAYKGK